MCLKLLSQRTLQNHLLSYCKWYYTGRLALIMHSSNYYKVNIRMYDSVNANGLKTFTTDCFNISHLQRWKIILNIIYIGS
jgi:hypothetical protein